MNKLRVPAACALILAVVASVKAAEVTGQSRIDAVTVFPSGAEVTRTAKVKLEAGEHVVVFPDLPASADPASIRVEGQATGKLEIGSVESKRLSIPREDARARDVERKQVEDEIERLRDEREVLDGAIQGAETQKSLIANLAQLPMRPAPSGASGPPEDWTQILSLIATASADASRSALDSRLKARDLDRKIADLEKRLAELAPLTDERTEVRIAVSAVSPVEAELSLEYQSPDASWSPSYDARLSTGGKGAKARLQVTRRASISQWTGEAWDNVLLSLSTSRPSAGSAAPEMTAMTVDFPPDMKPAPQTAAAPPPMARMREQSQDEADGMAALEAAPAQPEMRKATTANAQLTSAPFQATFSVPGRMSIPANGEAKRVQLQEDGFEPKLMVRAAPKLDAKAYLYAKFTTPKGSPILPGPVSLFRDGTFTGMGTLPVLASGEEHELGFGVDDLVRVRRELVTEKRGEAGLISSAKTDERLWRITVRNGHDQTVDLLLLDQAPASQNEAIKVELIGRPPPTVRDWDQKRGVVAWEDTLDAGEETAVEFGYRVTWPGSKTVVYDR